MHREHRHRRSGDDPRRGEEPRGRSGDRRCRRLRRARRRTRGARRRDHAEDSPAKLAHKAFARTAAYDAAIAGWFRGEIGESYAGVARVRRRARRACCATARTRTSRRPSTSGPSPAPASPPRGSCRARSSPTTTSTTPTPPSSWSPNSTRAARWRSSNTPIPAAPRSARRFCEAYEKALACDPVSAYGGIVALNRKLDAAAAKKIVEIFTEVIIAPDADEEAIKIVATKKNLRLLVAGGPARPAGADADGALGRGRPARPGARQRRARQRAR